MGNPDQGLSAALNHSEAAKKAVAVLGSTGSIGTNTLSVIADNEQRFEVLALSTNTRLDLLKAQIMQFDPKFAVVADCSLEAQVARLREECRAAGCRVR